LSIGNTSSIGLRGLATAVEVLTDEDNGAVF
jgi:hypothetical protein